jgi:hypothetical protein
MSESIDYAISMLVGTVILVSSYPCKSWCLWGIGIAMGLRAIVTVEIPGWKSNRKPEER